MKLTKTEKLSLEQAKRTETLIKTYDHIRKTQGEAKAKEWYNCWFR
jgi:hypothetical protein